MKYQRIFVLGADQFAAFCASKIAGCGAEVQVIDTSAAPNPSLFGACRRANVPCQHLRKEDRTGYLLDVQGNMLLISAINPWIIPSAVLARPGTTAINLHHSLLPRHRGRNAEAWAIFEGDSKAGITWHFVTVDVDAGNIIIQSETDLDDSITSLGLLRIQNRLAKEAFEEICEDILTGHVVSYPQEEGHFDLHYSWQVPNDGFLEPDWDAKQISRFLRAMDYGPLKILGEPKISVGDILYTWETYEIADNISGINSGIEVAANNITIYREDRVFKLKNVQKNIAA